MVLAAVRNLNAMRSTLFACEYGDGSGQEEKVSCGEKRRQEVDDGSVEVVKEARACRQVNWSYGLFPS